MEAGPDRDTPIASHSHATGRMFRCVAVKTNFMSLREEGRSFFKFLARLPFGDLAPQMLYLLLLGFHLPVAEENPSRVGA
jgi:hypothetical protein